LKVGKEGRVFDDVNGPSLLRLVEWTKLSGNLLSVALFCFVEPILLVPGTIGHSILRPENPILTEMMMIAFIIIKSSLVPLIEGLCAQIYFRFESQSSLGVLRPRAFTPSLLLLVLADEFIENSPFWQRLNSPIITLTHLENDRTPLPKTFD